MAKQISLKEALTGLDRQKVVFDYDPESDTLMMNFIGRGNRAVSLLEAPGLYIRWDPDAKQAVGIQFENFVRVILPMEPRFRRHLDLFGVTDEDLERAGLSTQGWDAIQASVQRLAGLVRRRHLALKVLDSVIGMNPSASAA
jgi:hypothetical protein